MKRIIYIGKYILFGLLIASNFSGKSWKYFGQLNAQEANESPSVSLSYSQSGYVFSPNTKITPVTPLVNGIVTNCVSEPALPEGLSLNGTTCSITGIPKKQQVIVSYKIIASNQRGSTQAVILIGVGLDFNPKKKNK